jgi:hypothetical protein
MKSEYLLNLWSRNHLCYVGDSSALVVIDNKIER